MAKQATQKNTTKIVKASATGLHVAPRKMRLVTNLVKNMRVTDALTQLQFIDKKGARPLAKLLQSAVANAENNFSLNSDHLFIKSITCNMGPVMRRYFPRARGSAFIIRHKLSHVNVVLEERASKNVKKSRFSLPTRAKKEQVLKTQEGSIGEPDQISEVAAEPVTAAGKPSELIKTNEQVKQNKVQNKRRLFNRRTGE